MPLSDHARAIPLALALVVCVSAVPASGQAEPPPVGETPIAREDAAQAVPSPVLDWQTLTQIDAQTYLGRLAQLSAYATQASELALAREPRERARAVVEIIRDTQGVALAIASDTLPEDPRLAGEVHPAEASELERLAAIPERPAFEEAYITAMIEAHREVVGLTSLYRRFGRDQPVREFARQVHPILESALYRAVALRQELVVERVTHERDAARAAGR